MCLHPRPVDPVPEETARVARAAFPKGTTYMIMRDELGAIFEDEDFAHLFSSRGQPAMAPWRLALVTISCSSPKDSQIARQLMPSERGSTGNMLSPSNSTTQDLMPRC